MIWIYEWKNCRFSYMKIYENFMISYDFFMIFLWLILWFFYDFDFSAHAAIKKIIKKS